MEMETDNLICFFLLEIILQHIPYFLLILLCIYIHNTSLKVMTGTWKYKVWLKTEIKNWNQLLQPTSAHTCFVHFINGNHQIFSFTKYFVCHDDCKASSFYLISILDTYQYLRFLDLDLELLCDLERERESERDLDLEAERERDLDSDFCVFDIACNKTKTIQTSKLPKNDIFKKL